MPQSETNCLLTALDHLVLTVKDIPSTIDFYTSVLGMKSQTFVVADGSHRHALKFGSSKINLHQAGHEFEPKATHAVPGSADLCFLTNTSMDDWIAHLNRCRVDIEDGPVRRTGATGPLMSIYLRDPDGNLIEISEPHQTD